MRVANESLSWSLTAWPAACGGAESGFDPGVLALIAPRRTGVGPRVAAAAVPRAGGARPANRVQLPDRGEVPLPAGLGRFRAKRRQRVATLPCRGAPDVTDRTGAPVLRVTRRHACFQAAGSDAVAPLRASRGDPQPIVPDGTRRNVRDPAPWPSPPTWAWSDHRPQAELDGVSERSAVRRAPGGRATGRLRDAPAWSPAGAAVQAFASAAPAAAAAIALAIDPGTAPRRAVSRTSWPCRRGALSPPLAGALRGGGAGPARSRAAP